MIEMIFMIKRNHINQQGGHAPLPKSHFRWDVSVAVPAVVETRRATSVQGRRVAVFDMIIVFIIKYRKEIP
jgi:hypothetical protein